MEQGVEDDNRTDERDRRGEHEEWAQQAADADYVPVDELGQARQPMSASGFGSRPRGRSGFRKRHLEAQADDHAQEYAQCR